MEGAKTFEVSNQLNFLNGKFHGVFHGAIVHTYIEICYFCSKGRKLFYKKITKIQVGVRGIPQNSPKLL